MFTEKQEKEMVLAYKKGMSFYQVAQLYGCSKSYAHKIICQHTKARKQPSMSKKKKKEIASMFERGYTVNQVHKAYEGLPGCSLSSIKRQAQSHQHVFGS